MRMNIALFANFELNFNSKDVYATTDEKSNSALIFKKTKEQAV